MIRLLSSPPGRMINCIARLGRFGCRVVIGVLNHLRWDAPDEAVNSLPAIENGFVTFGSLNNLCKVNDVTLDLWGRILGKVEGSHLMLIAPDGSARQTILSRLGEAGVDEGRIEFSEWKPRREYFKLYERIDLGLDTIPYNGHTTSLDSFWMGVPVVTLLGGTIVGTLGQNVMLTNLVE